MDLLFWHHDAAGFLALTIVAWALMVVAAIVAARLEEQEARAGGPVRPTRTDATHKPAGERLQPATAALRIA